MASLLGRHVLCRFVPIGIKTYQSPRYKEVTVTTKINQEIEAIKAVLSAPPRPRSLTSCVPKTLQNVTEVLPIQAGQILRQFRPPAIDRNSEVPP